MQFDLRIKQADGLSLTLAKAVKHFQRLFLEVGIDAGINTICHGHVISPFSHISVYDKWRTL